MRLNWHVAEGDAIIANQILVHSEGPARALLTGERTALNFLQLLSGTATAAHAYVALLKGTHCRLLDTRKTIPGLRTAQKYAVRVGGGHNHRMGLFDGILIKENHIMAAGSIAPAVAAARRVRQPQCRWRSRSKIWMQLQQAIDAGADIAMLDEFPLPAMREGVARQRRGGAALEARGLGRHHRRERFARLPRPAWTSFRSAASPSTCTPWTCRCASNCKTTGRFMPDELRVDTESQIGLQRQIRQQLVAGIFAGRFQPGQRLPSSRQLARSLGVARNTVLLAYQELIAEGHVVARPRSGLYLNESLTKGLGSVGGRSEVAGPRPATDWSKQLRRRPRIAAVQRYPADWHTYPYPFIEGCFDRSLFPRREWQETSRIALSRRQIDLWSLDTGDADDPELVEQIRDQNPASARDSSSSG